MPTKKAVRSKKKTTTRARVTATRKPAAKKAASRAAKPTAKPKAKAAKTAATGDKYRQSGAPWWKQFI